MTAKHLIILAIVILCPLICLSQTQQITEKQFYDGLRGGIRASEKIFPRRVTRSEERFEDGKLISTNTQVSEFPSESVQHSISKSVRGDQTYTIEMIKTGDTYFCRINDGQCKKNRADCIPMATSPIFDLTKEIYTQEKVNEFGKELTLFHRYAVYTITSRVLSEDKYG